MKKVNLPDKFSLLMITGARKFVGELNGQQVKLVKLQGEFVWHMHENENELFLCIERKFYNGIKRSKHRVASGKVFSLFLRE